MNIGKESECIEFKKSTSELKNALCSIAAILNKHGKGTLYFGVKDNGEVCGQTIGKETLRDISRTIRNYIKPECEFEVNLRKTRDNITFIEVLFSGKRTPYAADGKYYIRFSDQDRQMSSYELEKYFKSKIKDYSEWELSDSFVSATSVSEYLLKDKITAGYENRRIPFTYDNAQNILNKFGLLTKNKENLNNAGNVLFSKNKPILLKLATYATKTKDTFLKLEHFQGNVYECLEKSLTYILETIDWQIEIGETIQRKEEPEIPLKALREIIVNAFCHAQYDANTTFEISIFKDRVSIYSPGFFPDGFTPLDFALKHEEPIMLNPKIINVLFKTGEIESFGTGFANTFKLCEEHNIKYKYENTKSGFRFTFYRSFAGTFIYEMSVIEKQVFSAIKENNYIRASEISKKIKKSEKTVYRAIKNLKDNGKIMRIGDNFNGYWHLI